MTRVIVLLLAVLGASAHAGTAVPPQCPAELPVAAVKVSAPAGWVSHVPAPLALYSAQMASGPPEELAVLVGEPVKGRKLATSYIWTTPGFPQGMWLQCLYGDGGQVVISRRLPEPIRECVIEYTSVKATRDTRVVVSCS